MRRTSFGSSKKYCALRVGGREGGREGGKKKVSASLCILSSSAWMSLYASLRLLSLEEERGRERRKEGGEGRREGGKEEYYTWRSSSRP
jgi:hypothetical protein